MKNINNWMRKNTFTTGNVLFIPTSYSLAFSLPSSFLHRVLESVGDQPGRLGGQILRKRFDGRSGGQVLMVVKF